MTDTGTVFNIQRFTIHDGPGMTDRAFPQGVSPEMPLVQPTPRATKHMWSREYTRANAFLRRNAAFARRYVPRKAPSYFTEGG